MVVAQTSMFPVLIRGRRDQHFVELVPREHHFMSHSSFINAPPIYKIQDTGLVVPDQWGRFAQMLAKAYDQTGDIRIHGAYFGQCTKNFAV